MVSLSTTANYGVHHSNVYTKRICNFFPHAAAYLRSVATEGDCLSLASEASSLEMAGGFVPIRSAICAWVKPDASRAANSTSSKANSSRSMRVISLRNAASFIQPLTITSWETVGASETLRFDDTVDLRMINLLFAPPGNFQLTLGRGLGLLDKTMQHHNPPLIHYTIKHAGNPIRAFQSQLKQPAAHCTRVGHTQIRPELLHAFGISDIAGPHVKRQSCYIQPDCLGEIFNFEHGELLTNMLTNASAICAPCAMPKNLLVDEVVRIGQGTLSAVSDTHVETKKDVEGGAHG
jgi:hypothetical protein